MYLSFEKALEEGVQCWVEGGPGLSQRKGQPTREHQQAPKTPG